MLKTKFIALLLVVGCVAIGVSPAVAQTAKPTVIAVINYAQAMRESKAGQSVREQVDKQRAVYQTEIKATQTKLEAAKQELLQQQAVLAADAFARKRQEFQQQAEELQRTAQMRKRALDQMQAAGFSEIEKALRAVLEDIVKERGLDLVLNAGPGTSTVLMAGKEMFITEEAIKRLDQKLPKVTVKPVAE